MSTRARALRPKEASRAASGPTESAVTGAEMFRRLGLGREHAARVKQIRRGLPASVLEKLADELHVSRQAVLKLTKIAPATLTRRRQSTAGTLSPDESDRVYRVAAAYRSALQLFEGDAESARRWLDEPAKALGQETPLQHLATEAGAAEV